MTVEKVFDSPLDDPADDLLGISPYASCLADQLLQVPMPFTVGLYGEWGAGKTSFAHFVGNGLKQSLGSERVLFVEFSAWPHKTAKEIWQALVRALAGALYDIDPKKPLPPAQARPVRTGGALARFLGTPAFRIGEDEAPPDPLRGYRELLAKLDESADAVGGGPGRLDIPELTAGLVSGALASLGALSPLLGSLRAFFNLGAEVDAGKLVQREKNEALRRKIESIEPLKAELIQLFTDRAENRYVCLFIDDLDRTMPDVALDLLEALRNFLGQVPCVFLIAADENLIGQGLQLRFRALGEGLAGEQIEALVKDKGEEYFEKIIQLGIRMPTPTGDDVHRFVTAQFPQWMAASDLIYTALGANPRRLKQYCNLLRYKYDVTCRKASAQPSFAAAVAPGGRETEKSLRSEAPLLDRILNLAARSRTCLQFLQEASLAGNGDYRSRLKRLEALLAARKEPSYRRPKHRPPDELEQRADQIASSGSLEALFAASPRFSEADPNQVFNFTCIAGVEPGQSGNLKSADGCFQRILEAPAGSRGDVSAAQMLRDDGIHLAAVERDWPGLLGRLAGRPRSVYRSELKEIEKLLETSRLDGGETLPAPFRDILDEAREAGPLTSQLNPKVRALLEGPRLSNLLQEEIDAFAEVLTRLAVPRAESELVTPNPSDPERDRWLAGWVHERLDPVLKEAAEVSLQLRLDAARHLMHLRTFVKLDALSHCWHQMAGYFRSDHAGLIALEAQALQPGPLAPELTHLWDKIRQDERLLAFLRCRPLYRDADPRLVEHYFSLGKAAGPGTARPPAADPVAASYLTLRFVLGEPVPATEKSPAAYSLKIENPGTEYAGKTAGSVEDLDRLAQAARETGFRAEATREENADTASRPAVEPAGRDVKRRQPPRDPRGLGETLHSLLFGPDARELLEKLLQEPKRYRFLWEVSANSPAVHLPLEALFLPAPLRSFPALTQRYSVIRHYNGATRPLFDLAPTSPLRILVVLPEPEGLPPLNSAAELELLQKAFPGESGPVRLIPLRGPAADVQGLRTAVEKYQPHIFHFVGHGTMDEAQGQAAIAVSAERSFHLMAASQLAMLLRDNQVRIAVLNACDTGSAPTNDAISGLAGALVQAGVPAVVGTLRPVADDAALLFTRELYRSFAAGSSIEAAVVEGRKALSLENWDWSAYALFSGLRDLGQLRLPAPIDLK